VPYTIEDLNALNVQTPRIISSPWTAMIDWPSGLSSVLFDYYGLSYTYTDRTGQTIEGVSGSDAQFGISNQPAEANVTVSVKYKIIPRKNDALIVDTIILERPITFKLPSADTYKETLINRSVTSFELKGALYANWEAATNYTMSYTLLKYTDRSDPLNPMEKEIRIENDASSTEISGVRLGAGDRLTIQSAFMPDGSDEIVLANPRTYQLPEYLQLSRSGWLVPYTSTSEGQDVAWCLWDNNYGTGWHSKWSGAAPFPHILVIDMLYPVNIARVDIFRRNYDSPDTKTIRCYSGNLPDPNDNSWVSIGENSFPDSSRENMELKIHIPDTDVSGRYLKLMLPDSFRGTNCNIAEVFVYGR
jgi:hypothetical protein